MQWYLEVLKKYATFDGRARRKEYWFFMLFSNLIQWTLFLFDVAMFGLFEVEIIVGTVLAGLYTIAIILPSAAVLVRRMHDTGRSGWTIFIALIPIIGPIILLVYLLQNSEPGNNQYGPNPKKEYALQ